MKTEALTAVLALVIGIGFILSGVYLITQSFNMLGVQEPFGINQLINDLKSVEYLLTGLILLVMGFLTLFSLVYYYCLSSKALY